MIDESLSQLEPRLREFAERHDFDIEDRTGQPDPIRTEMRDGRLVVGIDGSSSTFGGRNALNSMICHELGHFAAATLGELRQPNMGLHDTTPKRRSSPEHTDRIRQSELGAMTYQINLMRHLGLGHDKYYKRLRLVGSALFKIKPSHFDDAEKANTVECWATDYQRKIKSLQPVLV